MKAEDIIRFLNENQGVIAAIPIIAGALFWFFRNKKRGKDNKKTQSVTIIGSGNYVEGQAIDTDIQLSNDMDNSSDESKNNPHIICILSKLKLPKIGSCLMLEFLNNRFVIKDIELKKALDKCSLSNGEYKITNTKLVELLKKFNHFNPNNFSISLTGHLYLAIAQELSRRSLSIEIQPRDKFAAAIPFHNLTQADFGISSQRLSIFISQ